jgi:hypothetical protein
LYQYNAAVGVECGVGEGRNGLSVFVLGEGVLLCEHVCGIECGSYIYDVKGDYIEHIEDDCIVSHNVHVRRSTRTYSGKLGSVTTDASKR